jgi:hypothetical protein
MKHRYVVGEVCKTCGTSDRVSQWFRVFYCDLHRPRAGRGIPELPGASLPDVRGGEAEDAP